MDLFTWQMITAALAAAIMGFAKAGFGGVGTIIAVPIMSLATPPAQTLGVLLPILLLIDLLTVLGHWKVFDRPTVLQAVPGALIGVAVGGTLLAFVDGRLVTLLIGLLAIAFALQSLSGYAPAGRGIGHPRLAAVFGALSGITSTVAHAGGPPIHIHLLSRNFAPLVFVATASVFMASVNVMKILPYFLLGQFGTENLRFSASLIPFAAISALLGIWVARRISKRLFAIVVNTLMILVGAKLIYDGLARLVI